MTEVVLQGPGLHGGHHAQVTLRRVPSNDEVTLRSGAHVARLSELVVVGTERATTVARADGNVRVGTVEHLFAALAGLGICSGLSIEVEGDELPLLDGASAEWSRALTTLAVPPSARPARLAVARDAVLDVGTSTYTFRTAGAGAAVRFETDDPRLSPDAAWSGAPSDFAQIAGARTFAFADEVAVLLSRGLASHVAKESVVLVAPDAIHFAGRPFAADEPARHKLLDLIGDLYLYGGPPEGRVHARRPGHAATHAAVTRGLAEGVLVRT